MLIKVIGAKRRYHRFWDCPHALIPCKLDTNGVMDQSVEDGIGQSGIGEPGVPC
jgi:hypothetical protein